MGRYGVKTVFDTIQGEGARTGTRAVFVRFTGCNLWDGNPLHRDQFHAPCSKWCDTDFLKGQVLDEASLEKVMSEMWRKYGGERWCVLTGGEPTLQMDRDLIDHLRSKGWSIAVETNGSVACKLLSEVDWVAVSPKRGIPLLVDGAHELKVVLPGAVDLEDGWEDEELVKLGNSGCWGRKFIQPQDVLLRPFKDLGVTALVNDEGTDDVGTLELAAHRFQATLRRCIAFIEQHPSWALSVQVNKLIGMP